MKKIIDIFRLRREERWPAFVAMLVFVVLNAFTVVSYWSRFSVITDSYHKLFVRNFHVSGFDPLTYEVVSSWWPAYNVYRHPLLAFFMYPVNQLNQGLMMLTGINFATVLTALVLVFCATYSFVFLYRLLRNVIGISRAQSLSVSALYFGFGFIMLSSMVPDHFIMSMFCLLLTLWLSGEKLKKGSALNWWQTVCLFILTAGVSLNNGLKVFMAALITRRKRFFRPLYLLLAVVVPACLMWGFARWEYRTYVWPKEMTRNEIKAKRQKAINERLYQEVKDSLASVGKADSAAIDKEVKAIGKKRAQAKYRRDRKKIWNRNTGKPIMKGEFMRWTDISTSRWDAAVENLFGEAIQLHRDHALGDVLRDRPVVVRYSGAWRYVNYGVEAIIVLLFLFGLWCGRKQLLMLTTFAFFLMDMVLHMGLGFGINEIYIMTAHYMYVVPIALGYLLHRLNKRDRRLSACVTLLVIALAVWCWAWNGVIVQSA